MAVKLPKYIQPDWLKKEIDYVFTEVVNACGKVVPELVEFPFLGEAGGTNDSGGDGKVVRIVTVPQLAEAWLDVVAAFRDPWTRFEPIREYLKENDLYKFIIQDDCDTMVQTWMKFKDFLENWAYNILMESVHKIYKKLAINEAKKAKTKVKPVYKNKAVVGGFALTVGAYLLHVARIMLPPEYYAIFSTIVVTLLAWIEHTEANTVKKELEEKEAEI